jgi:hypothetical protein
MLDVKNANAYIDFGKQLQPPPGYEIDYAVATTYTLDLYALLSIPLAMYYKQALDVEVTEDNFQILEAIQNLQKHLKIYCHMGKIALPKTNSIRLLAFIEKCVTEIDPKTAYESFHPKVWVLRFKENDSKEIIYRLIVMSRNLTFDKSYDIAYWMEGKPSKNNNTENSELVKLLTKLDKHSAFTHKKFISDLKKVKFDISSPFDSYNFSSLPMDNGLQSIDLNTIYKKRMVISPFLSDSVVIKLTEKTEKNNKLIVFSRKEELDKLLKTTTDPIEAYFFSQEIVNHHLYENADEGDDDQYESSDWNNNLHAKLFLRENKDSQTFWDLGSANCTNAAFGKNDEFLIHLKSTLKEASIAKVTEALLSEYNGIRIFKKYDRSAGEVVTAPEEDFRLLEYDLIRCLKNTKSFSAKVEPKENNYNLIIELQLTGLLLNTEIKLLCKPLGKKVSFQEVKDFNPVVFEDISLHELSSFIHWQVRIKNSKHIIDLVTKAEIKDMPDSRLSNILKSIIDNPDKFMALIMALLTEEPVGSFNNVDDKRPSENYFQNNSASFNLNMPVYEELLISLSRSPERLMRLSSLIEKLTNSDDNQIVPEEFLRIWKTIKELLPNG